MSQIHFGAEQEVGFLYCFPSIQRYLNLGPADICSHLSAVQISLQESNNWTATCIPWWETHSQNLSRPYLVEQERINCNPFIGIFPFRTLDQICEFATSISKSCTHRRLFFPQQDDADSLNGSTKHLQGLVLGEALRVSTDTHGPLATETQAHTLTGTRRRCDHRPMDR